MILALLLAVATVEPLPLPAYGTVTVAPAQDVLDRNPFAIGGGVVAADVTHGNGDGRRWMAVWNGAARASLPPPQVGEPSDFRPFLQLGAVAPDGTVYAERGEYFSGAYSGVNFAIYRLHDAAWMPVDTGDCGVDGTVHLFGVEPDGTLDLTFESPNLIQYDYLTTSGEYAPYAARLSHGRCAILGRFNLRATSGQYAAGFRGYFGKKLAPTNANVAQQRIVAVRWYAGHLTELGPGVALAVAPDGTTVGRGETHATLWNADGQATDLTPQALASTAYAIDASHRVLGTLLGRDLRHYAFLWERGHLHLLDDAIGSARWRFEGAYRFTPDGAIVGIGTYDGIATAFVVRNLET